MDPISKLVDEHRLILKMLDSLDRFASDVDANLTCDQQKLGKYAQFIKDYADAYHHSKEEDILFSLMIENGFSREAGPVAVMLYEHDEGRKLVKFMREAAAEPRTLTGDECFAVAKAIRNYTALLRSHISKEDNILYPMARDHIPSSEKLRMHEMFERVESEIVERGDVARLETMAAELLG